MDSWISLPNCDVHTYFALREILIHTQLNPCVNRTWTGVLNVELRDPNDIFP